MIYLMILKNSYIYFFIKARDILNHPNIPIIAPAIIIVLKL